MTIDQHKKSLQAYHKALDDVEQMLFSKPFAATEHGYRQTCEFFEALTANAWAAANRLYSADTPFIDWNHDFLGAPGLLNPDNRYQSAFLRPGGSYELTIRRGSHCQLTLQVMLGNPCIEFPTSALDLDFTSMRPGEERTLYFGGESRTENWYPLPDGAQALLIRQTFADWENESPSDITIRSLSPMLGCKRTGDRLALATQCLLTATQFFGMQFPTAMDRLPPNTMLPPRSSGDQGLAGQYSIFAAFTLADDEALLITGKKSNALYQSIAIGNALAVTPDFSLHQGSLSHAQTHVEADGSIHYVISVQDPEVPNWLDPAGNSRGMIFMRWQDIPQCPDPVSGTVVKLSELRAHLPMDTPHYGKVEREAQLKTRRVPPCVR